MRVITRNVFLKEADGILGRLDIGELSSSSRILFATAPGHFMKQIAVSCQLRSVHSHAKSAATRAKHSSSQPDYKGRCIGLHRGVEAYYAELDNAKVDGLQTPARTGFVAVEWGGMNLNGVAHH